MCYNKLLPNASSVGNEFLIPVLVSNTNPSKTKEVHSGGNWPNGIKGK